MKKQPQLSFFDSTRRKNKSKEIVQKPKRQAFNDERYNPMNPDFTSGFAVDRRTS
jgi:hypothetical protein